jgi:hypothetical protein
MTIKEIISTMEAIAPPQLQETYDNAGLITGNKDWECTGILIALDTTERSSGRSCGKKMQPDRRTPSDCIFRA